MEPLALGVDLGGTKIEAVLLGKGTNGEFIELRRERVPTEQELGYESIVSRTASLIARVLGGAEAERASVGVGMPGNVSRPTGLVKNSNTVCLNGRPFREDLARATGRRLTFENDANCFALAEATLGAGAPFKEGVVFGVIMGTGTGGGVVVRGQLWQGIQGLGGEWGHQGVWAGRPNARPCYCGQRGCLEQYASGPAVEADYMARAAVARSVVEIVARRDADEHARAAIESLLDAFGRGVANLINMLDPGAIVLGGGLSNLSLLLDEGRDRVRGYVFNDELTTPILKNALGDSAGVIGAALVGAALASTVVSP